MTMFLFFLFLRDSELTPVATVMNEYSFTLSARDNSTLRRQLAEQLNGTDTPTPV